MKPTVLLQLDPDAQPSVFDAVVAIDAGVIHLLRQGGVVPQAVTPLVHGVLFTRGMDELSRSAIFVGGSDVGAGEALLEAVRKVFFGPFRVSVLFDANGCNTTSAAAVLALLEGLRRSRGDAKGAVVSVLAATGAVGQRVARLLLGLPEGITVRIGSRQLDRAQAVSAVLRDVTGREAQPFASATDEELAKGIAGADAIIAAGASGVSLLPESFEHGAKVLIDLNAIPPAGIARVAPGDRGTERSGALCWGAMGVGGVKMKIHKRAIQSLFESNDRIIDAEECLAIGRALS